MASPIKTGKQPVQLAASGPRVSRIRRDPPPVVKKKVVRAPDERDQFVVVTGVIAFALALCVLAVAVSSYVGWSPSQYSLSLNAAE